MITTVIVFVLGLIVGGGIVVGYLLWRFVQELNKGRY